MIGPTLSPYQRANFKVLQQAEGNGDLALVSCRWKADGKPVAVVCAMQTNEDGSITPVPLATLFEGNPFELLEDPTEGDFSCDHLECQRDGNGVRLPCRFRGLL